MTDQPPETARAPFRIEIEERPTKGFKYRRFFVLGSGFWRGKTRAVAWGLTLALIASILVNVGLQYALNLWNKMFFDAIGAKDVGTIRSAIGSSRSSLSARSSRSRGNSISG